MNQIDHIDKKFRMVVPVYNGLQDLDMFVERVPKPLRRLLLFIDDGSTDGTGNWLEKSGYEYIKHAVNRGKGAAILSGMKRAADEGKEFIITLDVDLQHPPENLPEFISYPENVFVCGNRKPRRNMPLQRKMSNYITSLLLTVRCNHVIRDSQCGYRRIPLSLLNRLTFEETGFQLESEILVKACLAGMRLEHIRIPTIYTGSRSAIHPLKDTLRFIELWFRSFLWN